MKKTELYLIAISFLCILHVIFSGCYDYDQHSSEFTIKIDSISFPQHFVNSNDSLKVAFWGTAIYYWPDGQHINGHFLRFDISQKTDTCTISAIGYWCQGPRGYPPDCGVGELILNGLVCRIYPVQQGLYTVIVNQPDGSKLVKQIVIQ